MYYHHKRYVSIIIHAFNGKDTKSAMGPNISSTLPICDLFSRYTGALKYGIFSLVHLQTRSPSHECINSPSSEKTERIIESINEETKRLQGTDPRRRWRAAVSSKKASTTTWKNYTLVRWKHRYCSVIRVLFCCSLYLIFANEERVYWNSIYPLWGSRHL